MDAADDFWLIECMKKPSHHIPADARISGYRICDLIKLVAANRWIGITPCHFSGVGGVAEPLCAWVLNAMTEAGAVELSSYGEYDRLCGDVLRGALQPRLTRGEAQAFIDRTIARAEMVNGDHESEFIFTKLFLFGSVLNDVDNPGDVDIAFEAVYRESGELLEYVAHLPLSHNTYVCDAAASLLRGKARFGDLSIHAFREMANLGTPYQLIWDNKRGRVRLGKMVVPGISRESSVRAERERELRETEDFVRRVESFIASGRILPPKAFTIPDGVSAMTKERWDYALLHQEETALYAHIFCLPDGETRDRFVDFFEREFGPYRPEKPPKLFWEFMAASIQHCKWEIRADGRFMKKRFT